MSNLAFQQTEIQVAPIVDDLDFEECKQVFYSKIYIVTTSCEIIQIIFILILNYNFNV